MKKIDKNKKILVSLPTRLLFVCDKNIEKIIYNFLKLIYKNQILYSNLNLYYTKFVKENSLRE